MNFDPRLVQRLNRPLKHPGVTNHRMAEGLIERFQVLGNRLPLLDQQLSRWSTIVEFDAGQVPIVYAQGSEFDDHEVDNFQESLVRIKKELRSPIQNAPAQNSVKSPDLPVVPQKISASPIASAEASVTPLKAIALETPPITINAVSEPVIQAKKEDLSIKTSSLAPQNEQTLTQISDRPQIPIIPISNSPSTLSSDPLSFATNIPLEPSEHQLSSLPIKQVNTVNNDHPEITVQVVSDYQPELPQPLLIQPVSDGFIQARSDSTVPSIIHLSENGKDEIVNAIATPISTEFNSTPDAIPLVQQEIAPTPIASVETSVTVVKAIASSAQELSFVQLLQSSDSTPMNQELFISSESSLPKTSILPIDLPIEATQTEPTLTQISDRSQISIIPISNSPSTTLSSEPLSFAINTFSEASERQLSSLQIQQITPDYPQVTVQIVPNTQPEISQPLLIQPVSEGVIQARYDSAAPSMINAQPLISTVSDAPIYSLPMETAIANPLSTELNSASDAMPIVGQEISSTPIVSIELPVKTSKAIATQNEQTPTQISDRPQISSIPTTVQIVPNTQPEISQPLVIQPVSEGVIQSRYDSTAPSMVNAQPVISTVADPWLDSLPEVAEISWISSENPQNPMPIVNAAPITSSLPSRNPSVQNLAIESPTFIKVRKIDAQIIQNQPDSLVQRIIQEPSFFEPANVEASTVHPNLADQNIGKSTIVNITPPSTQTVYSPQDRLVFTPLNPNLADENIVVTTPITSKINNPKTNKATDSSPSTDTQEQINSSIVRTQIIREKVVTSNSLLPLSMEAMEDFQNSQPILTSVNNNFGKSPPQSPVLPTVQAIAEISEQIFEPLLLSRRSANASASEITENHPNQGQPNSRAIANSSNMITYPTSNSSTQTNIPSQLSPLQPSAVTNRSNQDQNNSMRPQNIPEVKETNTINMDLLVAQVERKIMKRLVVEGERRGKRKWL